MASGFSPAAANRLAITGDRKQAWLGMVPPYQDVILRLVRACYQYVHLANQVTFMR